MAGAPTKYKSEYNKQAYKLALLGATDKEMADFFDIVTSTLYEWKKEHAEFSESIKSGKYKADADVAKSLLKRAKGYRYKEVTKEGNFETGEFKTVKEVTKQVAPDTGAAMAWLKNRQPDKWRDKQEIEHSGSINVYENMTEEQLKARLVELQGNEE